MHRDICGNMIIVAILFREFFDLTKHMAKGHCLKYVHEYKCKICGTEYGISSYYYSFYYPFLSSHYSFIVFSQETSLYFILNFCVGCESFRYSFKCFHLSPPPPRSIFIKKRIGNFGLGFRFFFIIFKLGLRMLDLNQPIQFSNFSYKVW